LNSPIEENAMNESMDRTSNDSTSAASCALKVTEVVLPGVVEADGLVLRTRTLAAPATGQVMVKVTASGISFAEQAMRRGVYPGQPKFPFVPGYDIVGTVIAVGDEVDRGLVGQRVAAMTKTGGWASHVLLPAADLVPVALDLDPAEVETFVVNGVTAWQMLHRKARVRPGQTILVTGVGGAVGTTIAQLAAHHGVRVIGTAGPRHHEALRGMGVIPLDYNDPHLSARIRELAPAGVDAVFDHLGGDSVVQSWKLLAPHGTLVSYAIAAAMNNDGSLWPAFLGNLARVLALHLLPNGKKAYFYDLWSGHLMRPAAFRARVRNDLGEVLSLLASGAITARIAARMPLDQVVNAMKLAESRTAFGKVVLIPEPHDEH
jgi:NADPH:quinone reductase-like Zn-dependent oxidoreductase